MTTLSGPNVTGSVFGPKLSMFLSVISRIKMAKPPSWVTKPADGTLGQRSILEGYHNTERIAGCFSRGSPYFIGSKSRAPSVRARIASSGASRPWSVNARFTASVAGLKIVLRFSRAQVFDPMIGSSEPWNTGIT